MTGESEAIRHALSLVLSYPRFKAGEKQSAFLSYIVNTALEGNSHRLKAYNVAIDALGMPESFDPQRDTCVRVMAHRIRATLTEYNSIPNAATIKIELRPGSYIPIFTEKEAETASANDEVYQ